MRDKGQAAVEFLTTYGWGFLLLIAVIAAFTAFDPLSLEQEPTRCSTEEAEILCVAEKSRSSAGADAVLITLENTAAQSYIVSDLEVTRVNGQETSSTCNIGDVLLRSREEQTLTCNGIDGDIVEGQLNSIDATYKKRGSNLPPRFATLQSLTYQGSPSENVPLPLWSESNSEAPEDLEAVHNNMSGSGTVDDPYIITNDWELQAMAEDVYANYELGNNIDASGTATWNDGAGFQPVRLSGDLNGNGLRITGLTINRPNQQEVGLISSGYGYGHTIQNLELVDVNITGERSVGGLAGETRYFTVQDVKVTGSITGSDRLIGGVVGYQYYDSTLNRTYFQGTVTGTEASRIGGITGEVYYGERLENSYANATINGSESYTVGGIAGENNGWIVSSGVVGRVIGNDAGGITGDNSDYIRKSFAAVKMTRNDNGGISDYTYGGDDRIVDTYWDVNISNQTTTYRDLGTGLQTKNMTGASAVCDMTGLDFYNVWTATTDGYPEPRWLSRDQISPREGSGCGTEFKIQSITLDKSTYDENETVKANVTVQNNLVGGTGQLNISFQGQNISQDITVNGGQTKTFTHNFTTTNATPGFLELFAETKTNNETAQVPVFIVDNGTGTENDPYTVSTCEQLQSLSVLSEEHFALTQDIDCSDSKNWNDGKGFKPIGHEPGYRDEFDGTFDGQGHTIHNVYINRTDEGNVGFFTEDDYSTEIRNVTLADVDITGQYYVGGLIGYGHSQSDVSNVQVTGTVNGEGSVGGILGYVDVAMTNASFTGTVNAENTVGGIGGDVDGTITQSFANATINAGYGGGGIFSEGRATVKDSYFIGTVNTEYRDAAAVSDDARYAEFENVFSIATGDTDSFLAGYSADTVTLRTAYYNQNISPEFQYGTPLNESDMVGVDATCNFKGFNFQDTWTATNNGYPKLRWNASTTLNPAAAGCPAYFNAVSLTPSQYQHSPGDTATFTAEIENTLGQGTQNVSLVVAGQNITREVNISASTTKTVNISVDTTNISAGVPTVTLFTEDTNTTTQMAVFDVAGGDGSSDNPYKIEECSQLGSMEVERYNYFELTQDIDCSDSKNWNNGKGFKPIGQDYSTEFDGYLRGNNHTIDALYINRPNMDGVGLFGNLDYSEGQNIAFTNANITGNNYVGILAGRSDMGLTNVSTQGTVNGNDNVGGVVGYGGWGSSLDNARFQGSVNGSRYVGGIAGTHEDPVENVTVDATVTGTDRFIGGLFGELESTLDNYTITGSVRGGSYVGYLIGIYRYNTLEGVHLTNPDVSGENTVGGIVGDLEGNLFNSSVTGDLNVSGSSAGGIAGSLGYYDRMENVEYTGTITAQGSAGGIIGYGSRGDLINATVSGTVNSAGYNDVGGIMGDAYRTNIQNVTSTASVFGNNRVGGIVGDCSRCDVTNASTTGDTVNGSFYVGGIAGRQYNGEITQTTTTTTVQGTESVGGLIGIMTYGILSQSAAKMDSVNASVKVGGLVGDQNGEVSNSYTTTDVSGSTAVGVLVGRNEDPIENVFGTGTATQSGTTQGAFGENYASDSVVTGVYWDVSASQNESAQDATPLTTSEMQGSSAETNMPNLDYTSIWQTNTGDHPSLRFE